MKKYFFLLLLSVVFIACGKPKQKVDLLVFGATIYSMDKDSSQHTVMAIDQGKIVEIGGNELKRKYSGTNSLDLSGKFIYPGLIDAHSHFYGLGKSKRSVDLRGVNSEDEMIRRVQDFNNVEKNSSSKISSIQGRGWDQNLWESKKFPTNKKLNELYPDIPVCLTRIDGHAALVNQKALDLAGIDEKSTISGGEYVKENGKLTGVLIDNAVDRITARLPKPSKEEMKKEILLAQDVCLDYGLTTVCDAGIDKDLIDLYNEMHKSGDLKIRIYAMANPSGPTLDWLIKNGPLKTERLHVRSVKYYMDGAMGSRGACLLEDYSDQPGHRGFLVNSRDSLRSLAVLLKNKNLQLNVHCIGDSANRVTLKIMAEVLGNDSTSRWRIEHMQLISVDDLKYLGKYKIIPSMQPTHAWSDGLWVDERLGYSRLRFAYAIRTAINKAGLVALGTDFPVEEVNPFRTFYAAIAGKVLEDWTWVDFEKISRYQALQGMTIWAAYAQFEENDKGSLEKGKLADFIVMDEDLLQVEEGKITQLLPYQVYINGKLVAGK